MFYGLETISYRAPQSWTILPEEFKQRNTISLFKGDVRQWICNECPCRLCKVFEPNLEFIWLTAPNLVLDIHQRYFNACTYIYIYIYIILYYIYILYYIIYILYYITLYYIILYYIILYYIILYYIISYHIILYYIIYYIYIHIAYR